MPLHGNDSRPDAGRREFIEKRTRELSRVLRGIRPCVPKDELRCLYQRKDWAGIVEWVKRSMGVAVRTDVKTVRWGMPAHSPAWVGIAHARPSIIHARAGVSQEMLYATLHLHRDFLEHTTFEMVIAAFAHEVAHLVINDISRNLTAGDEEMTVDIAAILLGYRDFYRSGCVCADSVYIGPSGSFILDIANELRAFFRGRPSFEITFGYLTPDEVNFVADVMDREANRI